MSSIESLSDTEMPGVEKPVETDKVAQKRTREDSEGEWTTVGPSKKPKDTDKIEIYITCTETLPKQFALARMFKEQNISDIIRVKYLNPYKVRVDITNELSAEKLENCQAFKDKDWRMHKAFERNFSYGTVRNVDLDLTNEKILEKIKCPHPAILISVNRLNRRNPDKPGWIPSETVRLCFKGSFIPTHIFVDEMRVKVEKYEFPVTRCTRCWKFGHGPKKCNSLKRICPKCTKNHENCETTNYKCVNCFGKHMALSTVCPVYKKEKKLRSLMSEFNCTYRKALDLYIPPEEDEEEEAKEEEEEKEVEKEDEPAKSKNTPKENPTTSFVYTYAEKTKNTVSTNKKKPKEKLRLFNKIQQDDFEMKDGGRQESHSSITKEKESGERNLRLVELLRKLKEIIFMREGTIQSKVIAAGKCLVEWIIFVVVDNNITDWPIMKILLDYLQDQYG